MKKKTLKNVIINKNVLFRCFVIVSVITSLFSCVPDAPNYPDEPYIEFVSISKRTSKAPSQGKSDTIYVTFSFRDGDGDLSFPQNEDTNAVADIIFKDNRADFNFFEHKYYMPQIEPESRIKAVSGEITVAASKGLFCLSQQQKDTVNFTVWIKDRAGHISNSFETGNIIIQCQ